MAEYFSELCRLCGNMIDVRFRSGGEQSWKMEYQVLSLDETKTRLVEPNRLPPDTTMGNQIAVHGACWNIVERAAGIAEFSEEWLLCFYQCFLDAVPFLDRIRYPQAPDCLDSDIYGDLKEDQGIAMNDRIEETEGIFDRFKLPLEIIQKIFMFQDSYQDVQSLQKASLHKADIQVWLSLGHRFRESDHRLKESTANHASRRIQQIFWNLETYSADHFPHTRNLEILWNNAAMVLKKVDKILGTGFILKDVPPTRFYYVEKTEKIELEDIRCARHVRWHFVRLKHGGQGRGRISLAVRDLELWHYPCGIEVDGRIVGWKGDVSVPVPSESLRGIRMAWFAHMIFAVQVKTEAGWGDKWLFDEIEEDDENYYTPVVIEWPAGGQQGNLAIFYNTIGISRLSIDYGVGLGAMNWDESSPSADLELVPLLNVVPSKDRSIYSYFQCDISKISTIDGYVWHYGGLIASLKLGFDDGTYKEMGQFQRDGSLKVSFHVGRDKGEYVNALGYKKHSKHDGVSLKFYTSKGRVVTFGDVEVDDWSTVECPYGLFFCSQETNAWVLQNLGFFRPRGSEYDALTTMPSVVESADWTQGVVHYKPTSENPNSKSKTWISSGPISDISRITVYRGVYLVTSLARSRISANPITGLKISYGSSDRGRPPVILGDASGEELTTVDIPGRIHCISCHYFVNTEVPTCQIEGLVIDCGNGENEIEIGNTMLTWVDRLFVTKDHTTLYWGSDQWGLLYLQLSKEDLDLDQLVTKMGKEQKRLT